MLNWKDLAKALREAWWVCQHLTMRVGFEICWRNWTIGMLFPYNYHVRGLVVSVCVAPFSWWIVCGVTRTVLAHRKGAKP